MINSTADIAFTNSKIWIRNSHNYNVYTKIGHCHTHRETSRDALLEFIVSTENLSVCLRL